MFGPDRRHTEQPKRAKDLAFFLDHKEIAANHQSMGETGWQSVELSFGETRCAYHYGAGCAAHMAREIGLSAAHIILITDDTVLGIYGDKIIPVLQETSRVTTLSLPSGEPMKSLANLCAHVETAIGAGSTRRSLLVTFGGGVVGNLGGMVAALLFRGLRLVHLPTTIMAAMDSTLSQKQAINSSLGKNQIGAYHAPESIYVDVDLLKTLSARELRSGLCETAKNCLAIRPEHLPQLFKWAERGDFRASDLLLWAIEESLAAKAPLLARDAEERGSGLIFEYGHTIGHAVELCDQRLRGARGIAHGEAVAIGMVAAARIAANLGYLTEADVRVHEELVSAIGVTVALPVGVSPDAVLDVVRADNKRGYLALRDDEIAMVILAALGRPLGSEKMPLVPVPQVVVKQAIVELGQARVGPTTGCAPAVRHGVTA